MSEEQVFHNSSTIGRIGEYYVAYLLEKQGIETSIVDRTGTDLFCRRPDGDMFSLEVKTTIISRLPYKDAKTPRMCYTIRGLHSDWYAFVDLDTELVIFKTKMEVENYEHKAYAISAKEFSPYEMKKTLQLVKGFED